MYQYEVFAIRQNQTELWIVDFVPLNSEIIDYAWLMEFTWNHVVKI